LFFLFLFSFQVPIDITNDIKVLYIFVDIKIDLSHFIETVKFNFDNDKRLALVSTIQFAPSVHVIETKLTLTSLNLLKHLIM
jgi:2-(3-amino-3-carboxypropyl)histidine synthase